MKEKIILKYVNGTALRFSKPEDSTTIIDYGMVDINVAIKEIKSLLDSENDIFCKKFNLTIFNPEKASINTTFDYEDLKDMFDYDTIKVCVNHALENNKPSIEVYKIAEVGGYVFIGSFWVEHVSAYVSRSL